MRANARDYNERFQYAVSGKAEPGPPGPHAARAGPGPGARVTPGSAEAGVTAGNGSLSLGELRWPARSAGRARGPRFWGTVAPGGQQQPRVLCLAQLCLRLRRRPASG